MGEEAQEVYPTGINGMKPEQEKTGGEGDQEIASSSSNSRRLKWWILMIVYTIFVLAGQNVGTLLGRIYFNNGGKSQWMATLVQVVGFPILIPFRWLTASRDHHQTPGETTGRTPHFPINLALVYLGLGIFVAADCMLYSIGLQYLPVTTYTLICASQLGFNAVFSYFLNNQKFTPYIINSLVILTVSSVLLVFQADPGDGHKSPRNKYVIGFVCTVAASAGYAMMLSITQLAFKKIIKKETIRAIVDMSIWQSVVATAVIVVGTFASGNWRRLSQEMEGFETGKASYVMNLTWTAVSWQAFAVGCIGLIFKVSSLFSNVISILGLPVAPVLAVIILGDKMTGLKIMSMILALWGFVSYMYQHYLDDLEVKKSKTNSLPGNEQASEVALIPGIQTRERRK